MTPGSLTAAHLAASRPRSPTRTRPGTAITGRVQPPGIIIDALVSPRFSDCLVLEIARKAGYLPLGTFDRDLGKLDGAARI